MIAEEISQLLIAQERGQETFGDSLPFLASLQHYGAPTRLIDVSLDASVAAYFATEGNYTPGDTSEGHRNSDGRIVAWTRVARPKRGSLIDFPSPPPAGYFWRDWESREQRHANEWGTGKKLQLWLPIATNNRMLAQRAGFVFDAEPTTTDEVRSLITEATSLEWRADELAQATRILGVPTHHSRKATHRKHGMVAMFSIRVAAEAKDEIQHRLHLQGISDRTVYPDNEGYITYLKNNVGKLASRTGEPATD